MQRFHGDDYRPYIQCLRGPPRPSRDTMQISRTLHTLKVELVIGLAGSVCLSAARCCTRTLIILMTLQL